MPKDPVDGVIWDRHDRFNPAEAHQWNLDQIMDFSFGAWGGPWQWGIESTDPLVDRIQAGWQALQYLLARNLVFDPQPSNKYPKNGYIELEIWGHGIPSATVYDYFGWLLSVVLEPRAEATSQNFYLPLLSCFAAWCLKIARHFGNLQYAPIMVSIARYKSPKVPDRERVFLGASIPDYRAFTSHIDRVCFITHLRQIGLQREGLEPKEKNQLIVNVDLQSALPDLIDGLSSGRNPPAAVVNALEPEKGFGRCAETLFWIFAQAVHRDNPGRFNFLKDQVKGVALQTRSGESPTIRLDRYDEASAHEALRGPCRYSCQHLAGQIWSDNSWRGNFNPRDVVSGAW